MRRRKRLSETDVTSFESFVDVVCNLIGGLLLIAIISGLAAQDRVFEVFSPVEDFNMENARSYKFAVTDKGVFPLDQQEAFEKLVSEYEAHPRDNVLSARTRFSQWTLQRRPDRLMCRLRDVPPPYTDSNMAKIAWDEQLTRPTIDDDKEHFVYFFVSPHDAAFRFFRLARKALWDAGLRVGWAPVDPRKGVVLGGTIKLRPQD